MISYGWFLNDGSNFGFDQKKKTKESPVEVLLVLSGKTYLQKE